MQTPFKQPKQPVEIDWISLITLTADANAAIARYDGRLECVTRPGNGWRALHAFLRRIRIGLRNERCCKRVQLITHTDLNPTMAIFSLVEAKALPAYRLHLRYADGTDGEVDVSHLVGRGVFRAWEEPGVFESVRIGDAGNLSWGDDVDLCADTLYLKLTGKEPEDVFPGLGTPASHA